MVILIFFNFILYNTVIRVTNMNASMKHCLKQNRSNTVGTLLFYSLLNRQISEQRISYDIYFFHYIIPKSWAS